MNTDIIGETLKMAKLVNDMPYDQVLETLIYLNDMKLLVKELFPTYPHIVSLLLFREAALRGYKAPPPVVISFTTRYMTRGTL
jgi:hypothetical protein